MPRAGECHGWAGTAERGAGPARGGPGGPAAAAWGSGPHGAALPSGRGWRSAHLPLRAPEVARQAGQRSTRPGAVAGPPVTVALPSGGPRLQRRPATPHSVLAFESRQGPRSPLMPGSRTSHNPTTSPTSHGTRAPRGPSAAEWVTGGVGLGSRLRGDPWGAARAPAGLRPLAAGEQGTKESPNLRHDHLPVTVLCRMAVPGTRANRALGA